MINKNKLVLDTTQAASSDNVGAYIRSSDGTFITKSTVGGKSALDISVANLVELGVFAEDSVHGSGDNGQFILAVRNDADTSMVGADGDYAPLQVDANGNLKVVADFDVDFDFIYAEDSAHNSGDLGAYILSVRQDTLSASASDGDYQSLKTDALGRIWANNTHQTMTNTAVAVTSTVTDLAATDLANRKRILVQNLGNRAVYVGSDATVTTVNGIELPSGASIDIDIGPGVNIHAITDSGTQDVRVLQLA